MKGTRVIPAQPAHPGIAHPTADAPRPPAKFGGVSAPPRDRLMLGGQQAGGAGRHALAQSLRAGDLQQAPTLPALGPRAVMDAGSSPGHWRPLIIRFGLMRNCSSR